MGAWIPGAGGPAHGLAQPQHPAVVFLGTLQCAQADVFGLDPQALVMGGQLTPVIGFGGGDQALVQHLAPAGKAGFLQEAAQGTSA